MRNLLLLFCVAAFNPAGATELSFEFSQACRNGDLSAIKNAVKEKADLKGLSKGGDTCIHLAAKYGQVALVDYLLTQQIPVDLKNKKGYSPLTSVASVNRVEPKHLETAKLLIAKGANVNHQNSTGQYPLLTAYNGENVAMVNLLLKSGAHVNLQDQGGATALIWNVIYHPHKTEVIEALMKAGANPHLKTHFNKPDFEDGSAIDFAKRTHQEPTLKILQAKSK